MRRTPPRPLAALLATAVLALAASAAGPAQADPPPPPAQPEIVGVGTAADQSAFNHLSTDYNAWLTASGDTTSARLFSWDQSGPSPIVPKPGATSITRPANGRDGLTALNATTSATLDFDRAALGPQMGELTSDDHVALAKDGIGWAAPAGGNAPANLSALDLLLIYNCSLTNWDQINDIPGYSGPDATITPVLPGYAEYDPLGHSPYFSSDTATNFAWDVDASVGPYSVLNPGPCVVDGPLDNEGTDPVFNSPNTLVPYSAGRYVGQLNGHTTASDAPGVLTLRSLNGLNPVNAGRLNQNYTATDFGYVLNDVVRATDWAASASDPLRKIFGSTGWLCTNAVARADLQSEGFQLLPIGACGSVSHL
ncbi:hypothetical protein OG455_00880 [Kitasatospora sp. NBC_01287]|uniref:hypothetical protein n=1 Tax=Kitasatospora sp. NBC_01287 TaxID=2903573 RepID=UPI0022506E91|nr:hypothetical protein [Kitasatospora sp. NBC_01287]MCX4744079.1 hypothetical protein [Kitasatospora sp. NBC_01287]